MIITSPLKRAMHTAQIINATKNIPIIIDKRIIERDYGQLEGKPFKREYCDLDFEFESLGGESIENYKIRLNDFIKDIKSKYDGKNIFEIFDPIVLKLENNTSKNLLLSNIPLIVDSFTLTAIGAESNMDKAIHIAAAIINAILLFFKALFIL